MNQLVSIVSNNSDLKTKKIVVQKLEYGLLKLNQFGLTNEVEYFTEKLPYSKFDELMRSADILWCPVQEKNEFLGIEENGKSLSKSELL